MRTRGVVSIDKISKICTHLQTFILASMSVYTPGPINDQTMFNFFTQFKKHIRWFRSTFMLCKLGKWNDVKDPLFQPVR